MRFRYTYTPNIEYGPLDFDVRNRFVSQLYLSASLWHRDSVLAEGAVRSWIMSLDTGRSPGC